MELRGFWCGTEGGEVELRVFGVELRGVELRTFWCGSERCVELRSVELRGFRCGTEGFLVWN